MFRFCILCCPLGVEREGVAAVLLCKIWLICRGTLATCAATANVRRLRSKVVLGVILPSRYKQSEPIATADGLCVLIGGGGTVGAKHLGPMQS